MTAAKTLKEQLGALERLQQIDIQIDLLKKNRQALPAALKIIDDGLNRLKAQRAIKNAGMEELNKVQRQTKAAMDLNSDRFTRSNSRLEGIQNSQEFSAINKEIEQLRRLALTLEEQLKKTGAELETAGKGIADIEAQMATLQAERDEKSGAISGQDSELNAQIAKFIEQRKEFIAQIEPKILTNYDRVRGARAGLGIAPTAGGRCKACNMMVPPQLFNEVQKGTQLHSCPSCHRILYVPAETDSGAGQAQAHA